MSEWITDWSKLERTENYIVCPINKTGDRRWLGQPQRMIGWQVERLMPRLYAALPMPEFKQENVPVLA